MHLELDVVAEAEGFVEFDEWLELDALGGEAFAGAGVGGDDDAVAVGGGEAVQDGDEAGELGGGFDVFLAVGAD